MLASRYEEEVEKMIIPGTISAREAVDFLEKFPYATQIHWVGRVKSAPVPALVLIVVPEEGPLGVVFFRPDANQEWKVDFDAFARHSKQSVGDFMKGNIEAGTFRLTAAADNYFNGKYADELTWRCYCLKSPDHPEIVYGYCRRDGPQGAAMAELEDQALKGGQDNGAPVTAENSASFRATLELKRKPGADIRQVEIVSVVAQDWLVSGRNFDLEFLAPAE